MRYTSHLDLKIISSNLLIINCFYIIMVQEAYLGTPTAREKPASNRAATTLDLCHGPKQFHNNTEYTDRFKHHYEAQRSIPKPHNMETIPPSGPMQSDTTYRNDYIGLKTIQQEYCSGVIQNLRWSR